MVSWTKSLKPFAPSASGCKLMQVAAALVVSGVSTSPRLETGEHSYFNGKCHWKLTSKAYLFSGVGVKSRGSNRPTVLTDAYTHAQSTR